MKIKIKAEYNTKGKTSKEILEIDKKITEKIESIGGEWYGQGSDMKNNRDIVFDLIIK